VSSAASTATSVDSLPAGSLHHYDPTFLSPVDRASVVAWLGTLHPLWENRYPDHRPMRQGQTTRRLLRPVYWLNNWQFACLEYYRPPVGIRNRCVRAEPFPPVLQTLVARMEAVARDLYTGADLPERWNLNTCLINFYGLRRDESRWIDSARVRPHKDFEPGPVASLSLGERALFQFVENKFPEEPGEVLAEQWLEDGSLQMFGGAYWKDQTLHRVDRVERKRGYRFDFAVEGFQTRRVNFTFRYVPEEHIVPYAALPERTRADIKGYVEQLARHSPFFATQVAEAEEVSQIRDRVASRDSVHSGVAAPIQAQ
jgi:DNA oxidative demethylase